MAVSVPDTGHLRDVYRRKHGEPERMGWGPAYFGGRNDLPFSLPLPLVYLYYSALAVLLSLAYLVATAHRRSAA